jgi:hypothetical protein
MKPNQSPRVWPIVPKLCPGGTVVIFAGGPSLTKADVEYCRDKVDASIAINNSYKLAPWATALYAADRKWWCWHKGVPTFAGRKYSLSLTAGKMFPDVQVLKNSGREGLDTSPDSLRNGYNGTHQAINLAVHFGATRIVLLGVDMGRGPKGEEHWHGEHPNRSRSPYKLFMRMLATAVNPLDDLGIEIVNCSRRTLLTCFPRRPLEDVLSVREVERVA